MTGELAHWREAGGIRIQPLDDGTEVWSGPAAAVDACLVAVHDRLVGRSAIVPARGRPGIVAVRVEISRPAVPRARTTGRAAASRSTRWAWIAIAATCALALVGIAVALLLDALAAILPMLLGAAVVGGAVWLLLRLFGGGGGGTGGGGVTLTQTQTITIR